MSDRKIIYLDDAIDALRYAQHRFTVADEAGGMGTVKWSEDVIYFAAAERVLTELPPAQPDVPDTNVGDMISRQAAIDELEYAAWAKEWDKALAKAMLESLPSAQPDLITKMQNGIKATDADDAYSCGMRNGMRWCISLIDDKEPLYENCPSAQPEPIKINIEDFNKEDWERLKKEWGNTPITVLPAQPEIVRCKDCKHYVIHTLFGRSHGWCERLCDEFDKSLARGTELEDFCSRAERREE